MASSALPETLAIATVSNIFLSCGNGSPSSATREARSAISFNPPPAGSKPTPASTRADVTLKRGDRACAVHLEFAAAAKRHAAHRGNDRNQRILDPHAGRLEICDHRFELAILPALSRASAPLRSAPAENGSPVCQSTRALSWRSDSSTARCTPSSTASLTVFILVLNETMPTSSPRCHRRTPSFSHRVVPVSNFSPISGSGKSWRL